MSDSKRLVLVVDDEESMRYFLEKTLRREGYDVVTARDGPEAVGLAERREPDLALLDVRMPGMDGVALLRALRATHPRLPIVLMTAYGSVENALEAMKQGAADYVTKPLRVDEVRATVARALENAAQDLRPPTIRAAVPGGGGAGGVAPSAAPAVHPLAAEVPTRGLIAFLREAAAERGLPAGPLLAGDLGLREMTRLAEMLYVDELLRLTSGNISRAAEVAGITRPNMHRKIVDLGLSADDYR